MDLEQYKQSWKNQPQEANKLSQVDIYKMTHKNSSSIVKWIFIIGIAEFIFWLILSLLSYNSKYIKIYEDLHLKSILDVMSLIHYFFIIIFLLLFFRNYKKISVTDNTKTLTSHILKSRKTVTYYVYYNIISMIVFSVIIYNLMLSDIELLKVVYHIPENINNTSLKLTFIITQIIIIIIMTIFLYLFYRLIYGILLKKLNLNYKELNKLDEIK